jgi:hypothetical protein
MRHYTPVVRAKANDIAALELLNNSAKARIHPLIEAPVTVNGGKLETKVGDAANLLSTRLADVPFYFDALGIESTARQLHAFEVLGNAKARFTPTIGLGRGPIDIAGLALVISRFELDLAVRLDSADLEDASEDTWAELLTLTAGLGVAPSTLTIFLDFGQLTNRDLEGLKESALDFLAMQPKAFAHCKIIALGGTALSSVAPVPTDGVLRIARRELALWASLNFELAGTRLVGFGDYGIVDPGFVFPGGPIPQANAKIRYTRGNSIAYFRGHGLYRPGRFPQYHELARRVVESGLYLGDSFSYGDGVIDRCARNLSGPGNLGTWVKADTNHHVELTALQIPNLIEQIRSVTAEADLTELLEHS